ncbi:dermonecrotic toxin domain-containing protein [Pseudomonas sp. NPDC089396]|uniref:dermonecrotic toxin domain-containing protein n=1 Tax=Pseudomonas sp. NPDC089396 TaxID=3364461 RepID=UPI003838D894
MPTPESFQYANVQALPLTDTDTVDQQLAGRSNLLVAAKPAWVHATRQLQRLLDAAPTLQHALRTRLRAHLDLNPDACGLHHDGRQVTLLNFAARLLASPVLGNAFSAWATWGFDDASQRSQWTAKDWITDLNPVVNALSLQAARNYWQGRMPGTAISRQKHASGLLRQHFLSCLDIAFGIGKLGLDDWKQGRRPELSHAQLQWRLPTGTLLTSTAALALAPRSGDSAWLIYLPGINNAILRFDSLQSMRDWILLNRSWFWSDPRSPIATGTRDNVIVTTIETDGFETLVEDHVRQCQVISDHLLEQACEQSETDPLDWSDLQRWEANRSSIILATLAPATETAIDAVTATDTAMAQEEVHFAHLEQYLPSAWRQDQIEHQETLLAQYLDDDTAPTSLNFTLLRERQEQLDQSQDELDLLLLELPDQVTDADLKVLKGEETLEELISEKLCQALLKEARLQNTLGDLSSTHLEWIEKLVDRPEPSLRRPVQASTLELVAGDRKWQLCGYMTFRATPNDDTQDDSLLLYRPGQRGGLMAFDDQWQLARRLLATLQGAWPDALLESAVPTDSSRLLDALASSTAVTFTHPPILSHFMRDCVKAVVNALPAQATREQIRQRLCSSENRARAQAMARFAEQNRTDHIQQQLTPLQHLDSEQRAELVARMKALQVSLYASGTVLKGLPTQQAFSRAMLHQHLRNAFKLQEIPRISLDIADSVTTKKEVAGQSATGGAGARVVPVYSKERSDVALETFMLQALDDDRRLLLKDANVKFEPSGNALLRANVTPAYIAELIEQLDMAGSYERHIVDTFQGAKEASDWLVQLRQETLRAPYEDCLRVLVLTRPPSLDNHGQHLLETFCQEQVDALASRTIAYHTLILRPGTAADGSSDSAGLSDTYVIKGTTGPVLLYVPNAPVGHVISQHESTDAACEALQRMALDDRMVRFLALQADAGDPTQHESYINTALKSAFRFIALGPARREPMPTHQCHLDMGERIRKHRATSRSQADLTLSAPDSFDHHFFMGLKLALCFVPGAGTAIAAYDGWHAANAAVRAFGRGDEEEGLQHLVSVLQSLSDAIVSLALLGASSKPAPSARQLTLQRQRIDPLRPLGGIRKQRPNPFAGYEVEPPLGSLQRSTHVKGAGVLKLAGTEQHYIARNNTWYAVDWDSTYATWRLKPQGTRSYRQAVQLSESGTWDTPGRLSGLLVENGLAGGGDALSNLYAQGIAVWRTALGRQRPQLTGLELAREIDGELQRIAASMQSKQIAYQTAMRPHIDGKELSTAQKVAIANTRKQLSDELNVNIAYNEHSIARLKEQRATLNRADFRRFVGLCEQNINEMSVLDMKLASGRFLLASERVLQASNAMRTASASASAASLIKRLAIELQVAENELADTLAMMERIAIRHHDRRKQLQGSVLTQYMHNADASGLTLDVANTRLTRAAILSNSLFDANAVEDVNLDIFLDLYLDQGSALRSTLFSHLALPKAGLTRAQDRHFLTNAQRHYQHYLNHLTAWEDTFQALIAMDQAQTFRQLMGQLIKEIDDDLANVIQRPAVKPDRGPTRPRLFETEDGPRIGSEVSEHGQIRMHINRPNTQQAHSIYIKNDANTWQLVRPARATPTQSLPELVKIAKARLSDVPKHRARLPQYKTPDAIPIDLEDIAQGYAQQLRFLAKRIREKAGPAITSEHDTLVKRLDTSADELDALGRTLRIEQTKATGKPSVWHLDYLLEQQAVEVAWSRTLKAKVDRKGKPIEYLEEYRVNDKQTKEPVWYAHFHFRQRPTQGFTRLESGHLKHPSERNLGAGAWRGSLSEAQATRIFGNLRPVSD